MGDLRELVGKKLGFGCMRLPVKNNDTAQIDDQAFSEMVDWYLAQGFRYFDTAYPYHNGQSESAVKRCLVDRYPREKYLLADKMPVWEAKTPEDYQRIFKTQLERTGAGYFDFYLLHALGKERMVGVEACDGFGFVKQMKAEGKIKHIGFSFHDAPEVLDDILTKHPEAEFVQLQINYYDWNSKTVQSKNCYEVAKKHGIPVIVMEPVKGGTLASMYGAPAEVFKSMNPEATYASYAIRYAASLDQVMVVLSGMSNMEQMKNNTSFMKEFQPLNEAERKGLEQVVEELEKMPTIPCTKCRYCVEGCPKNIPIPDLFDAYNMTIQFGITPATKGSYGWITDGHGKASDCIKCGKCEGQCPQHLEIRKLLEKVTETFES